MTDQGTSAASNLADIARATLRHLAVNRMAPTPENYARAWEMVGGSHPSGFGSDNGPPTQPMHRVESRAEPVSRGQAPSKGTGAATPAAANMAAEAAEAVKVANRRVRLMQSMTELLETICDVVPELAWGEGWVSEQFGAIREAVSPADGKPDRGQLVQLRNDLRLMMEQNAQARTLRRDALGELKSSLPQWLARVSSLSDSSGDYGDRLTTFTAKIETASSLEDLASTLTGIVSETQAVRGRIDATRGELSESVERAEALEARVMELSKQLSATHAELLTDHLTGLLNRRGLESAFGEVWAQCVRDKQPLTVAMIDLDDFKQLNDSAGHAAGDEALRAFASCIVREFRPADRAARFGGDEFTVLLPGVGVESATEVVRRLLRSQSTPSLLGGPSSRARPFSAGLSEVMDGNLQTALERADDALYEAKRGGKHRIVGKG